MLPTFEILPARVTPRRFLAIVTGQHGDEYAGLEAGGKMIEYVRASLGGHKIAMRDGKGSLQQLPLLPIEDVTFLIAPALNLDGIRQGTRRWGCPPGERFTRDTSRSGLYATGVDLNRVWPHHDIVAPVWQAIQGLGGPVTVLDLHSSYQDRWGNDGVPDRFLFATGRTRAWLEAIPAVAERGWRVVDQPAVITAEGGPLEEVSNAAGHFGVTVELGEDDGAPGLAGCELLYHLVTAQAPI
jgi:predicted deacylase